MVLSGVLYLDGLVDMVDVWVGGLGDCEWILVIMKDLCSGLVVVVVLVLILLLKFFVLVVLFG